MACMPMLGRCMIFKKFHVWRNARACIKCSSWIVKEGGQEQHLTCKPNSCFFSFDRNGWHFGHKCLPFSLTWQVSFTCKSEFLQEIKKIKRRRRRRRRKSASTWDKEIEKNSTVWKVEKGEKKERKEKQDTRRYGARVLYNTTRFQ